METSYDYVIVGAGPAGSVLASRLTEHTDRSVLLLDAGGEVNNELGRAQGTFFMLWGGEADWGYQTTPQPELGGRSVYTPRGRAVAGSSAINVGVWTRGADADYDQWEALGLEGWNSRSAAEVFGRVEASVHAETDPRRGGDGPIAMEPLDIDEPIPDRLLEAFVEAGLGVRGDVNGSDPFVAGQLETIHKDRYRHTIADAYLTPEVRRRPHLTIVSNAIVTQVLFDGTTATGVRYTTGEEQHEVTATREVILSGGAINTPQILMHSGIGPGAQLQTLGIPVVKDAPGVGANLQDHIGVTVNVVAPEEVPIPEYPSADPAAVAQWRFDRTGQQHRVLHHPGRGPAGVRAAGLLPAVHAGRPGAGSLRRSQRPTGRVLLDAGAPSPRQSRHRLPDQCRPGRTARHRPWLPEGPRRCRSTQRRAAGSLQAHKDNNAALSDRAGLPRRGLDGRGTRRVHPPNRHHPVSSRGHGTDGIRWRCNRRRRQSAPCPRRLEAASRGCLSDAHPHQRSHHGSYDLHRGAGRRVHH